MMLEVFTLRGAIKRLLKIVLTSFCISSMIAWMILPQVSQRWYLWTGGVALSLFLLILAINSSDT